MRYQAGDGKHPANGDQDQTKQGPSRFHGHCIRKLLFLFSFLPLCLNFCYQAFYIVVGLFVLFKNTNTNRLLDLPLLLIIYNQKGKIFFLYISLLALFFLSFTFYSFMLFSNKINFNYIASLIYSKYKDGSKSL
jgi:zona occludens toxin (predicted ATPase)